MQETDIGVAYRQNARWQNWAGTQSCTPARIFTPSTLNDLVAIVRQAEREGRQIGVAGRGHSMGPMCVTDDYLVVMAGMNRIGPVDVERRMVTIEAGVTVGALDKALRRYGLAVPTNVVLTCVQYGGVISTGSHGAGWECQTVSDLVEEMTIVTYSGEVVTFSEATHGPEMMNAVRCNLGTFGIIYQIKLRVEPMFHLEAVDQHLPLAMVEDRQQLRTFLTGNDYVEVFWFPLAEGLWTKSWNRTTAPARRTRWTRKPANFLSSHFGNMMWRQVVRHPRWTGPINNFLYRNFTPRQRKVVLDAPDAQHYRDFIELTRCRIMSFAIKIDPDFANVQAAWQLVVDKVHERAARGEYPLNLLLEMRVIRNSQVLLSPAFGPDDQHHCYFELVSFDGTPGCQEFFDEVAQAWMAMPGLDARPHWGKYFYDIPGIAPHIRRVWGENFRTFTTIRDKVDPERMFLNPALEKIFYGGEESPAG